MLEAIMVIVVIGIIAAVAIPRLQNDTMQEASDQILQDIRFAQHMALIDDVTNPANTNWQRAFWGIRFQNTTDGTRAWAYTVGSDRDYGGNIAANESVIDQLSGLPIFGNTNNRNRNFSSRAFITQKYGITNGATGVTFANGCAGGQTIGFDRLGRPHRGYFNSATPNYASYIRTPCLITFRNANAGWNFIIQINPETGYAFRTDQPNM